MDYVRLLRPKQWLKNFFVFAALVFSRSACDPVLLGRTAAAFAAFCALSSGVYVLNDIYDRERDRLHPVKRNRPIASGRVPVGAAGTYAALLLAAGVTGGFLVNAELGLVALAYALLMAGYSLRLKELVLLDVFTIAAGFLLRVVAGVAAIGVSLSPWLFLCTLFLSLFLALGKRRHELFLLSEGAGEHRPVLDGYSRAFIDQMISIATSATIISYSLYTFLAPTSRLLMVTIPFVLYGLFRYLYVIYRTGGGGAPEDVLVGDRPLQAAVLLWIVTCILILYLGEAPGVPVLAP